MKTQNQTNTTEATRLINFSTLFSKGYQFTFTDGDNKIECWGSGFSGKEIVHLNGEKVSELRNMTSRESLHKFKQGECEYEVEFNMVSIITAELHCVLIKDGVHVATQKSIHTSAFGKKPMTKKRLFADILLFGFIGLGIGITAANYVIHDESPFVLINTFIDKLFG